MRKILVLLTILSFLIVLFTLYDYNQYIGLRFATAVEKGAKTATNVKEHLDSLVFTLILSGEKISKEIREDSLSEGELSSLLINEAKKLDFVSGITVAFEPNTYFSDKEFFSIFYRQRTNELLKIEDIYNYRDTTLATTKWYTETIKKNAQTLSKPYFGEAAQELLIDYAIPLRTYSEDSVEKVIGVLTYSISPNDFTEVVNNLVLGNSGYVYLTNNFGDIITHPNRNYILKHQVLDYDASSENQALVDQIISRKSGYADYFSPYTSVRSMLFFDTVDMIDWKVAVVYSRSDLMGNLIELQRKIIHIAMAISIFILLLIVLWHRIYDASQRKLWLFSVVTAVLFVLNIALIWIIQLGLDYSEELENRTRVYSDNALRSFVLKKNYEQRLLGHASYLEIPTGVFVEELLVSDSYNMSVSGKIWQKWPMEHDLKDKEGFHFIQASPSGRSVIVELVSKDTLDNDTFLYTWKFNATLRIFFDYNRYPLDQHYIDIKLIYPDMTDQIMLVPDFASYEVLNPSATPGLSDLIFLPRHRIIASYFSFSSLDMKTFFGQKRNLASSEYEALEYNVVIKRRFVTPFISFVIPFILGSSIIFFLLYSLNKDKEDKSGVTVMGVVQGMAALFFSMLLAHITIRNRIPTPQITYLETYYFVVYFMIAMLIMIVVMYSRSDRYKLLNYKDNLIAKLSYWPLLVGILYLITILKFY